MNIIIVGRRAEKRQVRWVAFLTLSVTLFFFVGLCSGTTYFLLCGRWSYSAVGVGGLVGISVVVVGFYRGLTSPLEKLRELPPRKKIE